MSATIYKTSLVLMYSKCRIVTTLTYIALKNAKGLGQEWLLCMLKMTDKALITQCVNSPTGHG